MTKKHLSLEATSLLLLLKQGKSAGIASGYAPDNPNGFVVRVHGKCGLIQDFSLSALFELARGCPLFKGWDSGPLKENNSHQVP